jgi:hypothetical protein
LKRKLTHLSLLYSGSYKHVKILRKIDPDIGLFLYFQNPPCPPVKKLVIKGLDGPPSPLSWKQRRHTCIALGERPCALVSSVED